MIVGGFMVPHPPLIVSTVGRGEEKKIQMTIDSYTTVAKEIAELKPETIIVTSPHSLMYRDYFHISPRSCASGSFAQFNAPQTKFSVDYDTDLVSSICKRCVNYETDKNNSSSPVKGFPAGCEGEKNPELDHATMVPLYFINKFYNNYKLVRIGLSGLSFKTHWIFGELIAHAVEDCKRKVVFVASGDLSHVLKDDGPYGFKKEGPVYDEKIMKTMGSGNLRELVDYDEQFCEDAAQCGHRSFTIMGGALEETEKISSGKIKFKSKKLSYEGPFGVGYGVCTYLQGEKDE